MSQSQALVAANYRIFEATGGEPVDSRPSFYPPLHRMWELTTDLLFKFARFTAGDLVQRLKTAPNHPKRNF